MVSLKYQKLKSVVWSMWSDIHRKNIGELWSCNKIDIYRCKIYVNTFIRYWASGSIGKGETVVDEGVYQTGERWYDLCSDVLVAEVKCRGRGLVIGSEAVVCHNLMWIGDFLGAFLLNYHVVLAKELKVVIF